MSPADRILPCTLALEDGTVLRGRAFGATGTQTGEVVFNTSMTGYQEILTDPSYAGQIVTMTAPMIGNYGVNEDDCESGKPHVAGFVIKELARRHSNYRATLSLEEYLARHDVIGLQAVDTRALTRKLRVQGTMRGVVTTETDDPAECVRLARSAPSMSGMDLVKMVAPGEARTWTAGLNPAFASCRKRPRQGRHIVAIDCGMKRNILRHLVDAGCEVSIVPPTITPDELLERNPEGVFVSNGPGDPAAVHYAVDLLKGTMGRVPVFGICLGHQLLALALGAATFKLKFGHRGGNHPVRNMATERVEITSQNHGFAVDRESLERVGGVATHINLNDKTLEGFVHREMPVLAVQYHPEASPGPHDASYLFDCFWMMIETGAAPTAATMADAQDALQHRQANAVPSKTQT